MVVLVIRITKEDVSFYDTILMIEDRVPLAHLNELFLEVKTLSEGRFFLPVGDLFIETKNQKHFFTLPISCQIELESVTFWEIKDGRDMAAGKEFSPFMPR